MPGGEWCDFWFVFRGDRHSPAESEGASRNLKAGRCLATLVFVAIDGFQYPGNRLCIVPHGYYISLRAMPLEIFY